MDTSRTPSASRRAGAASASSRKPLAGSSAGNVVAPGATLKSAVKRGRDGGAIPPSATKPRQADLAASSVGQFDSTARGPAIGAVPVPRTAANNSILTAVRIKPLDDGQRDGFEEGRGAVTRGKLGKIQIEMAGEVSAADNGFPSSGTANAPGAPRLGAMKAFAPEQVFLGNASQAEVYEKFGKEIVVGVLGGVNGCLTAYGQTGSGKTHTMLGDPSSEHSSGVIPRSLRTLFDGIEGLQREAQAADPATRVEAVIKASYVEVYQENVYDLLCKEDRSGAGLTGAATGAGAGVSSSGWIGANGAGNGVIIPGGPRLLKIRGDDSTGFFLDGVTEVELTDPEQAMEVLAAGFAARRTTATQMNARSSRSHALLSLAVSVRTISAPSGPDGVERVSEREAVLDVVDLAGSERQRDTGAEGSALKEAGKINNSLSHLAEVIKTLLENTMAKHSKAARPVPWRNSKLTMLLRRSLAGNSRTAMIFTITPATEYWSESINTLQFADRARKLKTEPSTNERSVLMGGTSAQIGVLQKELAAAKALIARLQGGGAGAGLPMIVDDEGMDGAGASGAARALDFGSGLRMYGAGAGASSSSAQGPWEGMLESSAGAHAGYGGLNADVVSNPHFTSRVNQLVGRLEVAGGGLTKAAHKVGAAVTAGPQQTLVKLLADAIVLKTALGALQDGGSAGLASGLSEVSAQVQAILTAHATGQGKHHDDKENGDEDVAGGRGSPKLARGAADDDTASARHRASTGEYSSSGSSFGGRSPGAENSDDLHMHRRDTHGFVISDQAAMASAVSESASASGSGAGGSSDLVSAVRSALLGEGDEAVLAAIAQALGQQDSAVLSLPVFIPGQEVRQLAGLLAGAADVAGEAGRCIPCLVGELKTVTSRAHASAEVSRSASAPRGAGPAKGQLGKASKGPAQPAITSSAAASAPEVKAIEAPALADDAALAVTAGSNTMRSFTTASGTQHLGGTGNLAAASMAPEAQNDGFKRAFHTAAQKMEAAPAPRISHVAPQQLSQQAEKRVRARSTSMLSSASMTVSRNESIGVGGARAAEVFGIAPAGSSAVGGGVDEEMDQPLEEGVPSPSAAEDEDMAGEAADDETGQSQGEGQAQNTGVDFEGLREQAMAQEEDGVAQATDGMANGEFSRTISFGASDMQAHIGNADEAEDGEDVGHCSPSAAQPASARQSAVSVADSVASVGTSISAVLERANVMNNTVGLNALANSGSLPMAMVPAVAAAAEPAPRPITTGMQLDILRGAAAQAAAQPALVPSAAPVLPADVQLDPGVDQRPKARQAAPKRIISIVETAGTAPSAKPVVPIAAPTPIAPAVAASAVKPATAAAASGSLSAAPKETAKATKAPVAKEKPAPASAAPTTRTASRARGAAAEAAGSSSAAPVPAPRNQPAPLAPGQPRAVATGSRATTPTAPKTAGAGAGAARMPASASAALPSAAPAAVAPAPMPAPAPAPSGLRNLIAVARVGADGRTL